MRHVMLGSDGPRVSAVGFGAMTLSPGVYDDPVDEQDALATIDAVVEAGVTLIDTADIYGRAHSPGHNEILVGRALRGRRDRIVLASKFGGDTDADGTLVPGHGRAEYVRSAIDVSLHRLGTDHLDLYYQHRLDPATPIEETAGAVAELVAAGKVRFFGLSEAGPATVRRAHAVHPVTAVQSEYSLFARDPEDALLPVLRELGVGFVAYSPLGRGLLGGRLRSVDDLPAGDWRRTNPRFQGENLTRNVALADTVRALAEQRGVPVARFALAWLVHQGAVPIPGSRHAANAVDNAAAADCELTDDELRRLDTVAAPGAASGARGHAAYLSAVDS